MQYNKDNPLRVITLCSGYDSQCLALERLKQDFPEFDYELVAWSEIDENAIRAHNVLFPQWSDRNLGDMTTIDWAKAPQCDLLVYSTPCFVAGTLVLTEEGYKPIEEIREGDMVLTHNNRYKRVVSIGKKPANEIMNMRAQMFDSIQCTLNHPFYVRTMFRKGHKSIRCFGDPHWVRAQNITKKDYIGFAINQKAELPKWDGVYLHRGCHYDLVNEIKPLLENYDFWYIVGRYIGDGWTRIDNKHKQVIIACSDRNKEKLTEALNSIGWHFVCSKERTCDRIIINKKEFAIFLTRYGKYAYGKHIDAETLNLPVEQLKAFLRGYIDSDGCFDGSEYRISTVSKQLAYATMQIIAKCYHRPSRIYLSKYRSDSVIEGRPVKQRNCYNISFHLNDRKQDKSFYEDGYCWFPIREAQHMNEETFVYNMEVEEDNSYTANGAIVHNCQSISQAGLQHGFTEGSGTRSSIIWYTREALKVLKPKYALLENVAAMVSEKFLPMYNLWANEVQRLGYQNFAKLLNAKNYGVPQNREHIFLLSIRDDGDMPNYNWPKPMPLTRKLNDMLDNNVDTRFYLNPQRVSDFVKENIVQIEKYTRQDDGEIEQLPDYLKEWLDNFESSKDDEKEESGEPPAECPYKEQEIGFDIS